jgi:hypothetical protein
MHSHLSHACYMPRPSHLPWFHRNKWYLVRDSTNYRSWSWLTPYCCKQLDGREDEIEPVQATDVYEQLHCEIGPAPSRHVVNFRPGPRCDSVAPYLLWPPSGAVHIGVGVQQTRAVVRTSHVGSTHIASRSHPAAWKTRHTWLVIRHVSVPREKRIAYSAGAEAASPTGTNTRHSVAALTLWSRSSSKWYLRIQPVPQREHHASPLQRSTG